MADESKLVVYAALASNVGVAAAKYVAATISGSSAMLSEAVHSSADIANQLFLLWGKRRSQKPPDDQHPFGFDGEMYFWAFVVVVLVLIVGGAGSIFQGVTELRGGRDVTSPVLNLAVLGVSAACEGSALAFSNRNLKKVVARHPGRHGPVSMWQFIKLSKDPGLYESLVEDAVALMGIVIAALGVVGSAYLGIRWMDGAASIAIGLLLIADAFVIGYSTRSLITGESAVPALRQDIAAALKGDGLADYFEGLKTLHIGPDTILVIVLVPGTGAPEGMTLTDQLKAIADCVRAVDDRIKDVSFDIQ